MGVRFLASITPLFVSVCLLEVTIKVSAKAIYPPIIKEAREVTYKNASSSRLNLWVMDPEGHKKNGPKPVIVFFFGGGWRGGTPAQFEMQCKYLASRGMVAITADYRVSSRHKTPATACVEDGKSAIRWIRKNADELGIDPEKVAAGGGSAGGHIAAATATLQGFDAGNESIEISSKPNALVLFNPALALDDIGIEFILPEETKKNLSQRVGTNPRELSPYHHLDKTLPPTLVFHGTQDDAVPFATVRLFQRKASRIGRKCRLIAFPEKPHGFFNWGRFDNDPFRKTMKETDRFLSELGWLEGKPTIDQFITRNQTLPKQ